MLRRHLLQRTFCVQNLKRFVNTTRHNDTNYINSLRPLQRFYAAPLFAATSLLTRSKLNLHQHHQQQPQYSYNRKHHIHINMGSINCKEYVVNKSGSGNVHTTTAELKKAPEPEPEPEPEPIPPKPSCVEMADGYISPVTVCKDTDIPDDTMKQFDFVDSTKVLLVKQKGKLYALGNKCTHYGAPLQNGVLADHRIRCPWHGACFDVQTGDIEDFPGLDSLPCFKVKVEDGLVKVRAKCKDLESYKRIKNMAKRDKLDTRTFVVIGGGPSGAVCAETLRQEGFAGRIVMLCREKYLPYDRVKVSKVMDVDIESIQFRDSAFYEEHAIEVMLGVEATKVEYPRKTIHCSDSSTIKYDKVYIATGCRPYKPPIRGAELSNVFTVRDYADGNAIFRLAGSEASVVCLGSSFIALESAAYLANKVNSVTVVARGELPLSNILGCEVGERIFRLFKDNNVDMVMNSGICEIFGNARGQVNEVMLQDGSRLRCDILIMGTGSQYYTDFLQGSGITMNKDGSVVADCRLQTNVPNIYVGGDIAFAPVRSFSDQHTAIGHYQLAQYHGRIAAINMANEEAGVDLNAVPFFFTVLFGKGIRYAGYGKFNDVIIDGDLDIFKFIAYYINRNDVVVGVASCGRDPIVAQFAELHSQGKYLLRSDLENKADSTEWVKLLKEPLQTCSCGQ